MIRWCVLILTVTLAGCASAPPAGPPRVPVRASVFADGKPAVGALVIFHQEPPPADRKQASVATGTVGADGSFELSWVKVGDGVPEGDYVVTVSWPGKPAADAEEGAEPPDRLGGRYATRAKSPLRAKVTAKGSEPDRFDVR